MARKAVSNDHYRLVGTYERLRKSLVQKSDDGRLDKALSYWVLPADRQLPIAFLGRPLRDLLTHPLNDLMATPGVGQKKILGFLDLLKRAAKTSTPDVPFGWDQSGLDSGPKGEPKKRSERKTSSGGLDASIVSESLWADWCETVRRYELGPEKLGRLAPSLQPLSTVLWNRPLDEYLDRSLAQIRQQKTHGEKRVHAILEVFCTVHEALATATLQENLNVVLLPRFIAPLCRWIGKTIDQPKLPHVEELHAHVVVPMIAQIRIDLGEQVAELAAARLCLDSNAPSVKQQAEAIGVTRARIYQLLEDCAKVMEARWPEGRWFLTPLASKFGDSSPETIGLLHGICDLFYPTGRPLVRDSESCSA